MIAAVNVLFVCSGNICRSPFADAYLRKRLSANGRSLQHRVSSAGTLSIIGVEPDALAVAVAQRDAGLDLRPHRSSGLSRERVEEADVILVMEEQHRRHLGTLYPSHLARVRLLTEFAPRSSGATRGADIADPIGLDAGAFRACFQLIRECVDGFLDSLEP
jgi:protein-tyrosine-phosphatase